MVSGPLGTGLWKGIMSLLDIFQNAIVMDVASGTNTRFWVDTWCSPRPRKDEFLTLFNIAINPNAMVADYLVEGSDHSGWNVLTRRGLNDWEIDHMTCLVGYLDLLNINPEGEDQCKWCLGRNGNFSVKLCYKLFGDQGTEDLCWKIT